MKKIISLILCLILMTVSFSALAETVITIQEKMARQIQEGSGLKGSFTLNVTGNETEIVKTFRNILGVPIQFRSLRNKKDLHAYIYQKNGEEGQLGLTELYLKDGSVYLRSDLNGDVVYSLPDINTALDTIRANEGGNPSFASLVSSFIQLSESEYTTTWAPVLQKYRDSLEIWLSEFAAETQVLKQDDGTTEINMNYVIPTSALNAEIVTLMSEAVQDADFLNLLKKISTDEQYALLSNPYLGYFFEEALSSQLSDGDIVMTRSISGYGEEISGGIELPLNEAYLGYGRLNIEKTGNLFLITLSGEKKTVAAELDPAAIRDLTQHPVINVRITPGPEADTESVKPMAFKIEISKAVDDMPLDESTEHHTEQIRALLKENLTFVPEEEERESYAGNVPEMTLEVNLEYKSNIAKNKPVNLFIAATLTTPENNFSFDGTFKTNAPWVFTPFETFSAVSLLTMTEEERIAAGLNYLVNAGEIWVPGVEDVSVTASPAQPEITETPAAEASENAAPEEASEAANDE